MKKIMIVIAVMVGVAGQAQQMDKDSFDLEMKKWKASLPMCDSVKAWYYYWSYYSPDGKVQGWGEYTWCRFKKPTKQEVLANVKKMIFGSNLKYFKYVKVDFISEGEKGWCPCNQPKKGF